MQSLSVDERPIAPAPLKAAVGGVQLTTNVGTVITVSFITEPLSDFVVVPQRGNTVASESKPRSAPAGRPHWAAVGLGEVLGYNQLVL